MKAKAMLLVTVSLGVLKARTINFVPALPENKASSIEAMGFGLINNTCIILWEDDSALVWPRDEMWSMLIFSDAEASGRWTTFFNPSSLKGRPTFTSFVAGSDRRGSSGRRHDEPTNHVPGLTRSGRGN
jgi:polyamine oxidase